MAEVPALKNKEVFCTKFYHLLLSLHLNVECSLLIPLQNIISDTHSTCGIIHRFIPLETRMQTEPLGNSGSFKNKFNSPRAGLCLYKQHN